MPGKFGGIELLTAGPWGYVLQERNGLRGDLEAVKHQGWAPTDCGPRANEERMPSQSTERDGAIKWRAVVTLGAGMRGQQDEDRRCGRGSHVIVETLKLQQSWSGRLRSQRTRIRMFMFWAF